MGLTVVSLRFGSRASLNPLFVSGKMGKPATSKAEVPIPNAQRSDSGSELMRNRRVEDDSDLVEEQRAIEQHCDENIFGTGPVSLHFVLMALCFSLVLKI